MPATIFHPANASHGRTNGVHTHFINQRCWRMQISSHSSFETRPRLSLRCSRLSNHQRLSGSPQTGIVSSLPAAVENKEYPPTCEANADRDRLEVHSNLSRPQPPPGSRDIRAHWLA